MQTPATTPLHIERNVNLRTLNAFALPALAATLVRVDSDAALRRVIDHADAGAAVLFHVAVLPADGLDAPRRL